MPNAAHQHSTYRSATPQQTPAPVVTDRRRWNAGNAFFPGGKKNAWDFRCLMSLCFWAGKNNNARMGWDKLGSAVGCTPAQANAQLIRLEQIAWIDTERKPIHPGSSKHNHYRIDDGRLKVDKAETHAPWHSRAQLAHNTLLYERLILAGPKGKSAAHLWRFLCSLIPYTDPDGNSSPGLQTIADNMGCHLNTVRNLYAAALEDNWILDLVPSASREKAQPTRSTNSSRRRPSHLHLPGHRLPLRLNLAKLGLNPSALSSVNEAGGDEPFEEPPKKAPHTATSQDPHAPQSAPSDCAPDRAVDIAAAAATPPAGSAIPINRNDIKRVTHAVMERCDLNGDTVRRSMSCAVERELRTSRPEDVIELLVRRIGVLAHATKNDLLRHTVSVPSFFNEGKWRDDASLPWKDGKRPSRPSTFTQPPTLDQKVREQREKDSAP